MQRIHSIQQLLRQAENAALVRTVLDDPKVRTRTDLVQEVCRRLDLRDAKGNWRVGTTLKALRDLELQGLWRLPRTTRRYSGKWEPIRLQQPVAAAVDVPARAEEVSGLELIEVTDREHRRIWNELMLREHPLQECRLVGRQLRYLVGSKHGWLGGIGFGSAALYLEGRDEWIGWTSEQRLEHLPRVLQMNRFLIRPGVRCENLASRVLGMCAQRVAEDFERRYGLRPWLLESFVDGTHYDGGCYKAANWIHVGQTKGRGRNGPRDAGKSYKDIYLYSLVKDVRARIGVRCVVVEAMEAASGLESAGWAQQEFGACDLGDPRRTRRLVRVVSDQASQPSGSYAQASGGNRHALKGYYRLLNNQQEAVQKESLLQGHRWQTIRRMKHEPTVLIVQDTTELNFSTRSACEGLGCIGSNQTGAQSRGLDLHSCLAVGGQSGLPLGVLRLHGYAPESSKGKDPHRPIQDKESYRWLEAYQDACSIAALMPETRVISVADREGDMFELFDLRRCHQGLKAELLVRAKYDRCLEGSDRKLFEELAAAPLAKTVSITVPRQREHRGKPSVAGRSALPARSAHVELRFKEVTLRAPLTSQTRHKPPLKLWAVYLLEKHPPEGATAVHWLLLTTIPIASVKEALKSIGWYCRRWRIEEWHRVMKSGCNILEHQNHSAEVLLRAIALDAVIAWRIMLLALLGREVPELPAGTLFDAGECEVLNLLTQKKTDLVR
jgi:hypothetical protein